MTRLYSSQRSEGCRLSLNKFVPESGYMIEFVSMKQTFPEGLEYKVVVRGFQRRVILILYTWADKLSSLMSVFENNNDWVFVNHVTWRDPTLRGCGHEHLSPCFQVTPHTPKQMACWLRLHIRVLVPQVVFISRNLSSTCSNKRLDQLENSSSIYRTKRCLLCIISSDRCGRLRPYWNYVTTIERE